MMILDNAAPPPDYLADPYAHFARWRAAAPLHYVPARNLWLATSYDMVEQLLRDDRLVLGVGTSFAERSRPFRLTVVKQMRAFFASLDEIGIDAAIRDAADDALRRVFNAGEADLVADIAQAIPCAVMGRLLGVPEAELHRLQPFSAEMIAGYDLSPTAASAMRGKAMVDAYFRRHLARARGHDITPLMTLLVRAQRDHGVADDVIVDVCSRTLSAGISTTAGCLGNILVRLLCDPAGTWPETLGARQTDALVEELIRLDTSVLAIRRRAACDFSLPGAEIKQGQAVLLMTAAANRDPAYFPDPDAVDLERTGKKHLSFGHGTFNCLGAPLSRKEIRALLERLLPALPSIELLESPARRVGWLLHEPAELRVNVGVPCYVD